MLAKFGTYFGTQNQIQKATKITPTFAPPFPHISGVQIMPRQKKCERGEKPTFCGIILSKRKGGIAFVIPPPFERYPQQQQQQQQQKQQQQQQQQKYLFFDPINPRKAL